MALCTCLLHPNCLTPSGTPHGPGSGSQCSPHGPAGSGPASLSDGSVCHSHPLLQRALSSPGLLPASPSSPDSSLRTGLCTCCSLAWNAPADPTRQTAFPLYGLATPYRCPSWPWPPFGFPRKTIWEVIPATVGRGDRSVLTSDFQLRATRPILRGPSERL